MEVFPTAYFAPIAYYQHFVNADNAFVEVKEHFVKQTIRTRCEILGPNGKQLLSIPVERVNGNKTAIEDVLIVEDGWRKIHWKTIETAYSSAAYFDYYGTEVKELLDYAPAKLMDFNEYIHQRVLSWLDYGLPTQFSSKYCVQPSVDYRNYPFDTTRTEKHAPYHQVFNEKNNCLMNLSILDLIFNQGPMARTWMMKSN
jgi:hypothetical protein